MKNLKLIIVILFSFKAFSDTTISECLSKFQADIEAKKEKKKYNPAEWEEGYINLLEDIVQKNLTPQSFLAKFSNDIKMKPDTLIKVSTEHPEWFCPSDLIESTIPVDLVKEIKTWLETYQFSKKNVSREKSTGPKFSNPFIPLKERAGWREKGYKYDPSCLDPAKGNYPFKKIEGNVLPGGFIQLDPKCMPDILFSWISNQQIQEYQKKFGNHTKNWLKPFTGKDAANVETNAIYAHPSPIATFGYGSYFTVRMKLKDGVRFLTHPTDEVVGKACVNLPLAETKDTVFVRLFTKDQYIPPATFIKMYQMEFTLCTMEVAHSWSFGLPETYDEQVREYLWVKENWHKPNHLMYRHKGVEPILYLGFFDNKNFTPATLHQKMQFKLEQILKGNRGKVFYNPKKGINKKLESHLRSKHILYWN